MSRARQASHVHVVADDLGQAVEDLARDWNAEKRQTWAIDTGTPDIDPGVRHPLEIEAADTAPDRLRASLSRARLTAERQALAAAALAGDITDPEQAVGPVRDLGRRIAGLDRHLNPTPSSPLDPWAAANTAAPAPAPTRPSPSVDL